MKIIYFATYYTPYLNSFLEKNRIFDSLNYEMQMQRIIDDNFGVWGSFAKYANRLGSEAHLLIANCEPMQKQWAKQNGFKFDENKWMDAIAIEQIKRIKPDVFFIGSMFNYYGSFLETIKPYCKKIFGWIACPIPEGVNLKQLSLILTSVPDYVSNFRKQGINSELLPAAFDAEILNYLPESVKQDIDFSFVGGVSDTQIRRTKLLEELVSQTSLELFLGYGYYTIPSWKSKLKNIIFPKTIEARYRGEAWGMDMYRILQRSKITFNAHGEIALGNRVNMRMYEATGAGTLLLTDKSDKSEVEYFRDGIEIVTYSSARDAGEKVKYYLENENERIKIAKAGQQRTLNQYNFETNMKMMLGYFEKYS